MSYMSSPGIPFSDIPGFLIEVRRRPGPFLGGRSIRTLGNLWFGIEIAQVIHAIPEGEQAASHATAPFGSAPHSGHRPGVARRSELREGRPQPAAS